MPVLMNDVAALAGVSVTTVSHVLNGTRVVAPDTRQRVLDAVRDLNYYTNASARLLARGRSDIFGLIISDIENPFFPELIKSFERACLEVNLEVILCTTNYDDRQARSAVRRMIESKVQGVAVMTSQLNAARLDELTASDTPVALLDCPPVRRGRSNLKIHYLSGAEQAIAHLRELGHREIGIISGPHERVSANTYVSCLRTAAESMGISIRRTIEGNNRPDGGSAAVQALLSAGMLPAAIVCGNDQMAFGAMNAVFEAGLRVPEDVSIIGADDISFARFSYPPLTTTRIPRDALGRAAFDALRRMVKSKRQAGVESVIETQLVVRQSTGRFAKHR